MKKEISLGDIEATGKHKGEIYGGIYPADNKPIWFSVAPALIDHFEAVAWAESQGGALPTKEQGKYLATLKGKGSAFNEIFNRSNSIPYGYIWLAEPRTYDSHFAWCQRLSDGDQGDYGFRNYEMPALCVKR
jgi:hypothetical protein